METLEVFKAFELGLITRDEARGELWTRDVPLTSSRVAKRAHQVGDLVPASEALAELPVGSAITNRNDRMLLRVRDGVLMDTGETRAIPASGPNAPYRIVFLP